MQHITLLAAIILLIIPSSAHAQTFGAPESNLIACIKSADISDTTALIACKKIYTDALSASSASSTTATTTAAFADISSTSTPPVNLPPIATVAQQLQSALQPIIDPYQSAQQKLDTIQQTLSQITTTPTTPAIFVSAIETSTTPVSTTFARNLGLGSSGTDVTALQTCLAKDTAIYPEGIISGYFGTRTQAALQRWQAAQEIVLSGTPATTGFGYFGPKSRTAMQTYCISTGATNQQSDAAAVMY